MNTTLLRETLLIDYVYTRLRRSPLKWSGMTLLFIYGGADAARRASD